jgi:NTE family protein
LEASTRHYINSSRKLTPILLAALALVTQVGLSSCATQPARVSAPPAIPPHGEALGGAQGGGAPKPLVPGDPGVPLVLAMPPAATPEVAGPPEPFGPPEPPAAAPPAPVTEVPAPQSNRPRALVLVLGPGQARAFAHVGAIRALHDAKIPVGAIFGTEMGALIGGVYASTGKINLFELAMQRFKDDVIAPHGGLLSSLFQKSAQGRKLDAELEKTFGKKDVSQSVIPFRAAFTEPDSGKVVVPDKGNEARVIRAALADPAVFDSAKWDGESVVSAGATRPYLVAEARALNMGPVVVIDAMDPVDAARFAGSGEQKDADLVIRPDLAGIGSADFKKRTDAAFRGKTAVNKQLDMIRQLVGRSS